jgi:hypothetical protein
MNWQRSLGITWISLFAAINARLFYLDTYSGGTLTKQFDYWMNVLFLYFFVSIICFMVALVIWLTKKGRFTT